METGKEVLLSTQHILKGLVKNRLRHINFLLWLIKRNSPPPPCVRSSSIPLFLSQEGKKEKKE
jgi:hypothetical protein